MPDVNVTQKKPNNLCQKAAIHTLTSRDITRLRVVILSKTIAKSAYTYEISASLLACPACPPNSSRAIPWSAID